ncbi:MAG: hypothetical protein EYC70_05770 [Planctomycetota bacterium]|nr:MAG: hypothetical protein EYC70_05770 [Planctomycetota bacterium]
MNDLARTLALAALLVLGSGCARGDAGRLPPFPPPEESRFPAGAEGAEFALRAELWPVGGDGEWLYVVGPGGWFWLGERDERGALKTLRERAAALEPSGTAVLELPEGQWSCAGALSAFLEARLPGAVAAVRGAPALVGPLLERNAPLPESDADAFDLAVDLALVDAAAALLPRLLGRVELSVRELDESPVADARVHVQPPLADPAWSKAWRPPALPEGIGVLRLELAGDVLWPRVEQRLQQWGFRVPPQPPTDLVLEVHGLSLGRAAGIVLALPAEWAPGERLLAQRVESWLAALGVEPAAGDRGEWLDLDQESFTLHYDGAVLHAMGQTGFRAELEAALARDRPQPFAERRWGWPRGGVGLVLDLRALEGTLRQLAPIPIPQLQGSDPSERIVEVVAAPQQGALRLHARWPSSAVRRGFDPTRSGLEAWAGRELLEGALRWLLIPEGD